MDSEAHEYSRKFESIVHTERAERALTLEEAEAEYFADLAFDERLETLLNACPPTVLARFEYTTTAHGDGMGRKYFRSNTFIDQTIHFEDDTLETLPEPAFAYELTGTLHRRGEGLDFDATILPDDELLEKIRITNTGTRPDVYSITKSARGEVLDFDLIDTEAVFSLLCQLGSAPIAAQAKTYLRELMKSPDFTPKDLYGPLEYLWSHLGELHGRKESVQHLSHSIKNPLSPHNPETIDLFYKDIETPKASEIEFSLIHTTHYPELDANESHRLYMVLEFSGEQIAAKHADKIIHHGNVRLHTLAATKELNGIITPLDLDVATIKELFVDWFDLLVSNPTMPTQEPL